MWYAVQVRSGYEEEIKKQCKAIIPGDILEQCFIPYYESMKRYCGEWHKVRKVLFPGYVFMISEDLESLFFNLKHVTGLTKILGTDNDFVSLSEEEVRFLMEFGKAEHVVEMSKGIITNSRVTILEGPLIGHEGCIKRIDRHRRIAYLKINIMGREVDVQVGLEIVEKRIYKS